MMLLTIDIGARCGPVSVDFFEQTFSRILGGVTARQWKRFLMPDEDNPHEASIVVANGHSQRLYLERVGLITCERAQRIKGSSTRRAKTKLVVGEV
jgi:hypothetical protein